VVFAATITYNAVKRVAQYLSDRSEPPHPTSRTVKLAFPMSHADIAEAFRAKIREIKAASFNTKFDVVASDTSLDGKNNRLVAIIDSIACNPGVYMPWKEMVKICKEEGVWSIVDAAHSIGQEVSSF
jgi:hercynylcysteine S-oxide lyase